MLLHNLSRLSAPGTLGKSGTSALADVKLWRGISTITQVGNRGNSSIVEPIARTTTGTVGGLRTATPMASSRKRHGIVLKRIKRSSLSQKEVVTETFNNNTTNDARHSADEQQYYLMSNSETSKTVPLALHYKKNQRSGILEESRFLALPRAGVEGRQLTSGSMQFMDNASFDDHFNPFL